MNKLSLLLVLVAIAFVSCGKMGNSKVEDKKDPQLLDMTVDMETTDVAPVTEDPNATQKPAR